MATSFYGEEMARYFRPEHTATLITYTPLGSLFAITRLSREAPGHAPNPAPLPREEAFLFALQLRELADLRASIGGKPVGARKLLAGALTLTDMRTPPEVDVASAFDSLFFHLSRPVLDELASDADLGRFEDFTCPVLEDLRDPVAFSLGTSLLPALERQHPGDGLFIDHASWALRYHLAHRYARFRAAPTRGGLTPRQLKRAKELMSEQLRASLTLSQLAAECGLSRSHFVRAFRQSTGLPPYRWLQRRRLERAQELLRSGRQPLREVAQACGFADASHLSRTFTDELGTSPASYRRTARR